MRRWIPNSEFEDYKWHRRAERIAARNQPPAPKAAPPPPDPPPTLRQWWCLRCNNAVFGGKAMRQVVRTKDGRDVHCYCGGDCELRIVEGRG